MKLTLPMPNISPVLRISIGLLLLTISLLLIGDLLGIVPNQQESKIATRKVMAESLAIQISSEVGNKRVKQAVDLLNIIVKRNEKIQSMLEEEIVSLLSTLLSMSLSSYRTN